MSYRVEYIKTCEETESSRTLKVVEKDVPATRHETDVESVRFYDCDQLVDVFAIKAISQFRRTF